MSCTNGRLAIIGLGLGINLGRSVGQVPCGRDSRRSIDVRNGLLWIASPYGASRVSGLVYRGRGAGHWNPPMPIRSRYPQSCRGCGRHRFPPVRLPPWRCWELPGFSDRQVPKANQVVGGAAPKKLLLESLTVPSGRSNIGAATELIHQYGCMGSLAPGDLHGCRPGASIGKGEDSDSASLSSAACGLRR